MRPPGSGEAATCRTRTPKRPLPLYRMEVVVQFCLFPQ